MGMNLPWQFIVRLILIGSILGLLGCGEVVVHQTDVRDLPDALDAKGSQLDTRNKVRSFLGKPLLDAQSLGVEVYRIAGRDINIPWVIYPAPLPLPGEKVVGFVLVVYDQNDTVVSLKAENWLSRADWLSRTDFRITARNFQFVSYTGYQEPDTLLAPSVSWKELVRTDVPEGHCSLVLVMGLCPMELVFLDEEKIADLLPGVGECGIASTQTEAYKRFILRNIPLGSHRLRVRQETNMKDQEFETEFTCEEGETIYTLLDVISIRDRWWGQRLDGEIAVTKSPPKRLLGIADLYPILWHAGTWYGPMDGGSDASTHQ